MQDSLKYVKIIEDAGFTQNQAETLVKIWMNIMSSELATKQDWMSLKTDLSVGLVQVKHDLELHRKDTNARFTILKQDLCAKIEQLDRKFESKFSAIDSKFETIDSRFESIDSKFDTVNSKLVAMEYRLLVRIGAGMAAMISISTTFLALFLK